MHVATYPLVISGLKLTLKKAQMHLFVVLISGADDSDLSA